MTDFAHETVAVDYRTPRAIWEPLHAVFRFEWDLMASDDNHLFPHYFTEQHSLMDYYCEAAGARCFVNPAWGRGFHPTLNAIVYRLRKMAQDNGCLVVALLPSRTDVKWQHDDVIGWADLLEVRGRITYDAPDGSGPAKTWNKKKGCWEETAAMFPSVVAVWSPGCEYRASGSSVRSWDPYNRAAT